MKIYKVAKERGDRLQVCEVREIAQMIARKHGFFDDKGHKNVRRVAHQNGVENNQINNTFAEAFGYEGGKPLTALDKKKMVQRWDTDQIVVDKKKKSRRKRSLAIKTRERIGISCNQNGMSLFGARREMTMIGTKRMTIWSG